MAIFILTVGVLLSALGFFVFIGSLPAGDRDTPLKEAFSQIFKEKKVQISFCCFISGSLIVLWFLAALT